MKPLMKLPDVKLSDDLPALICRDKTYSHANLEKYKQSYARILRSHGIASGTKVAVFLQPGIQFLSVVLALFEVKAVPVFIDPSIGKVKLEECLECGQPDYFIGNMKANILLRLFLKMPKSIKKYFYISAYSSNLKAKRGSARAEESTQVNKQDVAAVFFTSGSTGPPKGVEYSEEMLDKLMEFLLDQFGYGEGDKYLCTFPPFSLFAPELKLSVIFPEMNFSNPGASSTDSIVAPIAHHQIERVFASPALVEKIVAWKSSADLASIRQFTIAGAPVRFELLKELVLKLHADCQVTIAYGATEILTISTVDATEVLADTSKKTLRGMGICVGDVINDTSVKIVPTGKNYGEMFDGYLVGEITVSGPRVSCRYHRNPSANQELKYLSEGKIWHRTGDIGYFDERGRLWYLGRKTQHMAGKSIHLSTISLEAIANRALGVRRSALVKTSDEQARLLIEPDSCNAEPSLDEIRSLLGSFSREIESIEIYRKSFPTDIRHNAKIDREKLSVVAGRSQ